MFKADMLCEKNARHCSWGSGQSEIDDRCRLPAGITGVLARLKASWGREKNRHNTTYPNSNEEEKAILGARIQFHRVRGPI